MISLRGGWSGCSPAAVAAVQQVRLHEHCDVIAAHDADPQALAEFAAGTGVGVKTASFDELLGTGIDFVVLAGPTSSRLEQVRAAAEQGVHCLCTLPFAADAATAAAMAAAADAAEVKLGALVPHLADPLFDQVRRMLAADWLGGVTSVVCAAGDDELLRSAHEPAHHPFVARASAHVHVVSWLTGRRALRVTAQSARTFGRGDDTGVATAVLRGNVACTFTASHVTRAELVAVYGTDGRVHVSSDRAWFLGRTEFRGAVLDYVAPGHELATTRAELEPRLRALLPEHELLGRFARWIDDRDDFPCPGEQAVADLQFVDAMMRAVASGRAEDVSA